MARISGVELPQSKKILFALPYVYGLGLTLSKKVLELAKVDSNKRVKDLTEEEVSRIAKEVDKFEVEGDLKRLVIGNIRRLEDLKAYRGIRHRKNLPVRGQRTRSNARTKRGKRVTIGAMKKEAILKIEAAAKTKAPAPATGGTK